MTSLTQSSPILSRAEDLARRLALRSAEFEELRQLPADVTEELVQLGVFRMFVPASLGGAQLPPSEGLDVLEALAYGDGAVGWCAMIGATTALLSGFLEDEWARQIYGPSDAITGGVAEPRGRARRVPGGLEVTGEWSWGSGTFHAQWIGGGCLLVEEDRPPELLFVYFERSEVELLDTWYAAGLRGSGSTDFRVDRVVVPEKRWVSRLIDPPAVDAPLYRFPNLAALAIGVAAVALGLARRSVDELVDLAGNKSYVGSRRTLAERAGVQAEVSAAQARCYAARAFLDQAVSRTWDAVEHGEASVEDRRRVRLAATHAVGEALAVGSAMFQAGGGAAVYSSSPLQRVLRDLHVVATHGMVAPRTHELFGRLALGLETRTEGL